MTDKFLSGWGMAENKTNKLVIECDNYDEALIVENNARNRSEMRYVGIRFSKPYYNTNRFLTNYHDKTDYSSWFKPNYFNGDN